MSLPEIKVVRYIRAKRLRLVVSQNGIRLTAPVFISNRQIKAFIDDHQAWLKQAWSKYQAHLGQSSHWQLPETLHFSYFDAVIHIQYVPLKGLFQFNADDHVLMINEDQAAIALTHFVCQQAKQILSERLYLYAQRHQLTVNAVRIATPKARWGSCSSDQRIMLHAGLLLMPTHFADYVVLHELAHTKHMNHQAIFWQLLENLYPDAKKIQKQVRTFRLPPWWQTK